MRYLTCAVCLCAVAGTVAAQISGEVVITDPTAVLGPGYVTNDIVVNAESDWLSAVMLIELTEPGMIYQDPLGSANPQSPNPLFFPVAPTLEYDTYVSNGVLGESVSTAAAVDLGEPVIIFDTNKLAISWYTTDGDDLGMLTLTRITLSNMAQGVFEFRATASPAGGPFIVWSGIIENGRIPEPATMALLGLGGLAVLARRRR